MDESNEKPISVLIVDDEQDLVDVLSKRLRKRGFEVQTADSGEAALLQLDEPLVESAAKGPDVPTSVLVVDDETELRTILSKRLSRRGYTVNTAQDGRSALAFLDESSDVDVVVLDVKMVGMSGLEALKAIRARHPLVQVIMLTGHGSVQDAMYALQDGAVDYLTKPCDINVLLQKLSKAKSKHDAATRTRGRKG